MGNRFQCYGVKKTGQLDDKYVMEIGWVEAEKMTVQYRLVVLFAFCQDLCSNLTFLNYLSYPIRHALRYSPFSIEIVQ